MMRAMQLTAMVLVLAFATACDTRPTAEIEAAREARAAAAARAGQYAPESLKAAQESQAALDAELVAQDAKWIKSYDRTRELANAAKLASDKARDEAVAARERADAAAAATAAKAKADTERRAKLAKTAVHVGGAVRNPTKIKDVAPVYPAIAKSARVSGTVQIELTIGLDGKVADWRVVKGVPLLDEAALDAVKQWEYTPTRVKGVAVPVIINVAVNFKA
jgi:TonB family protein